MGRADLLAWIPEGHPDEMLVGQVNFERLPAHIAIIMDGNGRWAAQRHLPRVEGHRAGIDAVRDTVETAARLGINVLTLYAFSIENWKRPATEISTLMMLLKRYLRSELKTLLTNDIRFRVIGRMDDLANDIQDELRAAIDRTANDTGMLFNIALNYGGRAEIVDAARRAIEAGIRPEELDEQRFASFLYTAGQPDPDLLIRTSGEMRVSNYLLWQIAYTEIYVTETLWPDFRRRHLLEAVARVPEARAALRRHRPSTALRSSPRSMTRVISGVLLAAAALAAILLLPFIALRVVVCLVAGLAADEYVHMTSHASPERRAASNGRWPLPLGRDCSRRVHLLVGRGSRSAQHCAAHDYRHRVARIRRAAPVANAARCCRRSRRADLYRSATRHARGAADALRSEERRCS